MMLGNLIQSMSQPSREGTIARHRGRWNHWNKIQDSSGRRLGCCYELLKTSKDALAFIQTANGIVCRGCHTIRRTRNVVWDDHARTGRIRLVQSTELPQVVNALTELPLTIV